MDFNPNLPGYIFEYAPTPLAAGGVGLYIYESLRETVIGKKKNQMRLSRRYGLKSNPHKKVTSCGIIYRQHNSPKRFQEYFDETLEKLIASNKSVILWPTST